MARHALAARREAPGEGFMNAFVNHQFKLGRRPVGMVQRSDFEYTEAAVASPGEGEVLIKILYISLDPAMRGLDEGGRVQRTTGSHRRGDAGRRSRTRISRPTIPVSPLVRGWYMETFGVRDLPSQRQSDSARVDAALAPLTVYLGTLGMPGMTAYFGLLDVGQGESGRHRGRFGRGGRSGPVQSARSRRSRAVAWSNRRRRGQCDSFRAIGFDAAIDYQSGPGEAALEAAALSGRASTCTSTTWAARSWMRC